LPVNDLIELSNMKEEMLLKATNAAFK